MKRGFKGWTPEAVAAHQSQIRQGVKNVTERARPKAETEYAPPDVKKIEIGVDPGTHTGIAVKVNGVFNAINTVSILEAIDIVRMWSAVSDGMGIQILVRFEDARLRTYFGKSGPEKWKGAGSIMRDCAIWEEFLTSKKIPFQKVHPKTVKATDAKTFEKMTGWNRRTSIHAREAAWQIL